MARRLSLKNIAPEVAGLLQAGGLTLYIILISLLLNILNRPNFWVTAMGNFSGPLLFLLLFVIAALICALIVFTYPAYLAFNSRVKEAIITLLGTPLWLVIFGFLIFLFVLIHPSL